jgi:uncharacterized protein (TIGR01777 family)
MKKIVIAGGTGFLGKVLINFFKSKVDHIIVFTRGKTVQKENIKYVQWDIENFTGWEDYLENADVLINLAGKSVDCRYNEKNKEEIMDSRVSSTLQLQKALEKCINPPSVWLNASTATIYKHSETKPMTEANGEIGNDFSMGVAKAWEATFFKKHIPGIRKVALRTSIVLGKDGGAFSPLKKLAYFGLGGKQGKGNQMVSWIHEEDFARIVAYIINDHNISGVVNVTAPRPITNEEFMKALRRSIPVKIGINISGKVLEIGAIFIRTETELILKSRYVIPAKLEQSGFVFKYPDVQDALKNLLQKN